MGCKLGKKAWPKTKDFGQARKLVREARKNKSLQFEPFDEFLAKPAPTGLKLLRVGFGTDSAMTPTWAIIDRPSLNGTPLGLIDDQYEFFYVLTLTAT